MSTAHGALAAAAGGVFRILGCREEVQDLDWCGCSAATLLYGPLGARRHDVSWGIAGSVRHRTSTRETNRKITSILGNQMVPMRQRCPRPRPEGGRSCLRVPTRACVADLPAGRGRDGRVPAMFPPCSRPGSRRGRAVDSVSGHLSTGPGYVERGEEGGVLFPPPHPLVVRQLVRVED